MNTLHLGQVEGGIGRLPSLSAIVLELLASQDREDVDVAALAGEMALDQALTARALKLANSSCYGLSREVTSVQAAISILGFNSIRAMVTAALIDGLDSARSAGLALIPFWRHSIGAALCARALAAHCGQAQDNAYTVGLLHDIGRLLQATQFPAQYSAVLEYQGQHDRGALHSERVVHGLDHTQAGAALARHWKFPQVMQEAIAWHHEPQEHGALAGIVHGADALAHALDLAAHGSDGAGTSEQVLLLCGSAWASLALTPAGRRRIFGGVAKDFEAACLELAQHGG